MYKHILIILALGMALAQSARADIWQINIDTTSLAGTDGYLDLQLNPGTADAQPVQARIVNFSTDAVLGASFADGTTSGSLESVLVLDNTEALNAWLQGLVLGNHIAFTLDMDTALSAGSGSTFAAVLWDANFNAQLAATGEDAALRIDLMPTSAPAWTISPAVQVSAVPESSNAAMFLAGLGLMGFVVKRRASV